MNTVVGSLSDVEPEEPSARETAVPVSKGTSGRKSFSNLRRELSDEELSSPAIQRMLLDEIERLDSECGDLRVSRENFHRCDKRVGILEERFRTKVSLEIMHVTCFLLSGSAFGYAASNWTSPPTIVSVLALIFGGFLPLPA